MTASGTTSGTPTGRGAPGSRTVVGIFTGPEQAEQAVNSLKAAGFTPEQVSILAKDTGEARQVAEHTGMGKEAAGAGTGAVLGGLTGGALGWLVGIGALLIPGVGPIIAAGALATALGGAAIGAAAGGLIGGLVALGIPEEDARGYEESIRQGRILLGVSATDEAQAEEAQRILDAASGGDVRAYGADSEGAGARTPGRTTA